MNAKRMLTICVRPQEGRQEAWDTALFWGCVFSVLWLICRCLTGLAAGFSAQYALEGELPRIVLACLGTCLTCLLREGVRSWMICFFRCSARHPALLGALLAGDFGLLSLSRETLTQAAGPAELCRLLIGSLLPGLVTSVLLTVMAYYGGLLPPLIYSLVTEAVPQLLPVTPGQVWLLELLVGVVLPLLFLMTLCMQYDGKEETPEGQKKPAGSRLWLTRAGEGLFLLALTGFVAFFLGLLPWHPLAVATGSMEPLIQPGDMAILADVQPEELTEGDVIQFRRENYMVLHRIVEVREDADGATFYITKGDANNAPDEQPVDPEQVTGRLVGKVPGVGWLTLWMRSE